MKAPQNGRQGVDDAREMSGINEPGFQSHMSTAKVYCDPHLGFMVYGIHGRQEVKEIHGDDLGACIRAYARLVGEPVVIEVTPVSSVLALSNAVG